MRALIGSISWVSLTDPGFDFSVLSEFRDRLLTGSAEALLLDKLLDGAGGSACSKRGQQRTDSTHVLAAIRVMNRLELVAETLRAALNALATVAPDWLQALALAWYERYSKRIEDTRLPQSTASRDTYAQTVGEDGFHLLDALDAPETPAGLRELPVIATLRQTWQRHYERSTGEVPTQAMRPSPACASRPTVTCLPRRKGSNPLRSAGALPPQTRHFLDRLHGAYQRNVRAHRPASPHTRPHDPCQRP